MVVMAQDAEGAALWLLHTKLESLGDVHMDLSSRELKVVQMLIEDGVLPLGTTMHVSERGFGRSEAGTFQTNQLLKSWRTLIMAVSKLADRLDQASLDHPSQD